MPDEGVMPPAPVAAGAEFAGRTAPPTTQRPIVVAKGPSRWPTVIGIISAVLGGGGVLTGVWGIVQNLLTGRIFAGFPGQAAVLAVQRAWRGPMLAVTVPGVLLSTLLFTGAILLMRRRAAARAVLLGWAGLRVVQGLAATVVMALMQQEHMQAATTSMAGTPGGASAAGFTAGVAVATAAAMGLWALSWPVFVFIWFSREKVRTEMRAWIPQDQNRVA